LRRIAAAARAAALPGEACVIHRRVTASALQTRRPLSLAPSPPPRLPSTPRAFAFALLRSLPPSLPAATTLLCTRAMSRVPSGLPALDGGLPQDWKRLSYNQMVVWDTSELKDFQAELAKERERVIRKRDIAIAEQRKVMRKNALFELEQIDRIETWIERIYVDKRRKW